MFCIFHDGHDLLGRPVQIEHVDHHGEVVRNKRTESDCKRNRGEHDKERDDCHKCRISQCSRTSRSVIVKERLSSDNHDFYKRWRTCCDIIEQPFPRKFFPPLRHTRIKYSKGLTIVIFITQFLLLLQYVLATLQFYNHYPRDFTIVILAKARI